MHQSTHLPVLVEEVMEMLRVRADGVYLDATCGPGGHAAEILRRLGPQGRLLALDRDPQAVAAAQARFGNDARVAIRKGPFSSLGAYVDSQGLCGRVNGILFDLGISSAQLDDPNRGFGFLHEGPLDMRMDYESSVSAANWLNSASELNISRVLKELGEERYAKRIARAIIRERARARIATTSQLARIVSNAVPTRERNKHPATRTFLAVRLFVNQELDELRTALPQALPSLALGGRLVVISFHSLEDRIVKHFMREEARAPRPQLKVIGKVMRPSRAEVRRNSRARSALLRVAERTETEYA